MSGVDALPVIILCGGRGTRIAPDVPEIPKPLVEVGGIPIVEHIIAMYSDYGSRDFLLALGYRGEMIRSHFAASSHRHGAHRVECIDTGESSPTGERIRRLKPLIAGRCFATYGDGVSDIDLERLLAFHRAHGKAATITVIRPESNFGIIDLDGDAVVGFREKPRMTEWINGGFFVFEREVFDGIREDEVLERGPMERLAAAGELMAYRHEGFWRCMDTFKDALALNELCQEGTPPWRHAKGRAR